MSEFDVRTSFVSFVDHLPSDIVRKLWLIQSLNITYETQRDELDALLRQLKAPTNPEEHSYNVKRVLRASARLTQLRREVVSESKSIVTTIKMSKMQLTSQHEQLEHDHKMYQNEKEMKETLLKHSQRNHRRVKSQHTITAMKPTQTNAGSTLLQSIERLTKELAKPEKKRGRGRPSKEEMDERARKSKMERELHRLRLQAVEEEAKAAARATIDSQMSGTLSEYEDSAAGEEAANKEDGDEEEELYCICRGPSHGDMIACDDANCLIEWFHYSCVGLLRAPKGKWYCQQCQEARNRQRKKQK